MIATPSWSRLRLRQSPQLRALLDDTTFTAGHLVQPIFVVEGIDAAEPVEGLGENKRFELAGAAERIARDVDAGVRHVLLFAVPEDRQAVPSRFDHLRRATETLKRRAGDAIHLWVDLCLCAHTRDGHCGLFDARGGIDLGTTLGALASMAVAAVSAGADGVSPSDMMDGRTAAIRAALDDAGQPHVPIMSYSTKFASTFYGPFRAAAGSAPRHGDRRRYQIDVRSRADAIGSSVRCSDEGADLLMVKPGLTSLDLIGPIRDATARPVGAYQVSGEYAALAGLAGRGDGALGAMLLETWYVFRRAGAAFIITYGARDALKLGMPA